MSIATWFDRLPVADQRKLRELARVDAARRPLQTPGLVAWRQSGCRFSGPVWRCAMWEMAALDATSAARREMAYLNSRMIAAIAKGETRPEAAAA